MLSISDLNPEIIRFR